MVPSRTNSSSTPAFSRRAAARRRASRTSAQACRSAPPPSMVDRLPAVTPSFGLRPVSAGIMRMRPESTSSSSAAICARREVMPWPIATLPVRTSTMPSVLISTHRSSRLLRAKLGGSEPIVISPAPLANHLARASYRAQDAVVGAAPAQMDVQLGTDLRLRRRRIAAEQRRGANEDAGQAVAALARLLIDEGLLQRMRCRLAAQTLNRGDLPALHR